MTKTSLAFVTQGHCACLRMSSSAEKLDSSANSGAKAGTKCKFGATVLRFTVEEPYCAVAGGELCSQDPVEVRMLHWAAGEGRGQGLLLPLPAHALLPRQAVHHRHTRAWD